jgi:hypothetical protein
VACLAASVYLVYVLEIFKFKGVRAQDLRAAEPEASEDEIEAAAERDVETENFEKVK